MAKTFERMLLEGLLIDARSHGREREFMDALWRVVKILELPPHLDVTRIAEEIIHDSRRLARL